LAISASSSAWNHQSVAPVQIQSDVPGLSTHLAAGISLPGEAITRFRSWERSAMSIRAVARRWNAIAAALGFEPEIIMPTVCGLEAFGEEEPLIVSFEGCRRDLVADIVFGSEKWPEVSYTSFVPINLEPGPALNAVIATRTDLLVSLSGATNRIRHVRGIEAGGHLAVHGVSAEKIGFKQSRLYFARIASRAKASSSPNVHAFELTYD
jgi:hypothetical protein